MSIKKIKVRIDRVNIDFVTQVLSSRKGILFEPYFNGISIICHEPETMPIIAEMLGLTYTQDISITLASVSDV